MSNPIRPISEIFAELTEHPDFVIGQYLSREHVAAHGIDPDRLSGDLVDDAADGLSQDMLGYVIDAAQAYEDG